MSGGGGGGGSSTTPPAAAPTQCQVWEGSVGWGKEGGGLEYHPACCCTYIVPGVDRKCGGLPHPAAPSFSTHCPIPHLLSTRCSHPSPPPPSTPFPSGARSAGGPENLLVATHTRSLLVYRGSTLAWSARGDTQPAAVAVADLGPALRGVIVTLDDAGALVVSYLGTDPMLTPVGLIEV